jgi:hypothetical protein
MSLRLAILRRTVRFSWIPKLLVPLDELTVHVPTQQDRQRNGIVIAAQHVDLALDVVRRLRKARKPPLAVRYACRDRLRLDDALANFAHRRAYVGKSELRMR